MKIFFFEKWKILKTKIEQIKKNEKQNSIRTNEDGKFLKIENSKLNEIKIKTWTKNCNKNERKNYKNWTRKFEKLKNIFKNRYWENLTKNWKNISQNWKILWNFAKLKIKVKKIWKNGKIWKKRKKKNNGKI